MSRKYERMRAALGGNVLPAAVVDLDAVDRNIDTLLAPARRAGKTLRVATKSLRCVELLRYVARRGEGVVKGWMAYAAAEVAFLVERGFDDIFLAYPTVHPRDTALLASLSARGARVSVVVDELDHIEALDRAAREAGVVIDVVIEIDMALQAAAGRVHLGVLRSPVSSVGGVLWLAGEIRSRKNLRLLGLMGYEAQIAGLPDRDPLSPAMGRVKRLIKSLSRPHVARLRAEIAVRLAEAGFSIELFNGGGSGSIPWTVAEPHLTEVTAGSGFVTSHLFDHYDDVSLEPALFFALQVVRAPRPGVVTCSGGGYIASGAAGPDRLPRPWLPEGLRLTGMEGAGEVQTPLLVPPGSRLRVGDPVFFRHAKAGELAERFSTYHFVRGQTIEGSFPTYRGEGGCFG